ncbi:MAG: hypothetical protein JWM68_3844 [Verrucomicrobiales bacterium]|nr:hypothetical protein [Verrucomicrobiales bacterium]
MSTIRQRLTRRLLLGWSLLLIAGGMVTYLTTRTALTRQFDDALGTTATALSAIIEQDSTGIQVDIGDPFLRRFDTNNGAAYFQLWNSDGSEVTRSESLGNDSLPSRHPGDWAEFWDMKLASGLNVRAMAFKFRPHPADAQDVAASADAIMVVATDRRQLDKSLAILALVLTGSGLLVLILTAVAVPWLLRRELAPLNSLAEQTQRITAESLSERFPLNGLPGELTPISTRLNDLLQRLQTSFVRERQFSDDLAHEFRTPIAELRSLAELSLKWPEARGADPDRNVLEIALQMETIIRRLLAIARSEQGQEAVETQRIDLAQLIATVCLPLQKNAAARQLKIQVDVPADLTIESDPVLLRSILTNLLENAVEYSATGGAIQIHGKLQNGDFTLQVINPVQQLSSEDVPHLFERFWRKDPARTGGEHSGLGLSLSRAFATSLGYNLTAALNSNRCLTITLSGRSAGGMTAPRT